MAIQISYLSGFGPAFPAAYARVSKIVLASTVADIDISIYSDVTSRQASKTPLQVITLNVRGEDFDAYFSDTALRLMSPTQAAYTYAKTLPLYKSGRDV